MYLEFKDKKTVMILSFNLKRINPAFQILIQVKMILLADESFMN